MTEGDLLGEAFVFLPQRGVPCRLLESLFLSHFVVVFSSGMTETDFTFFFLFRLLELQIFFFVVLSGDRDLERGGLVFPGLEMSEMISQRFSIYVSFS